MRHIPAHTSAAAVREGKLTAREQYGNGLADQRAKEGAALQAPHSAKPRREGVWGGASILAYSIAILRVGMRF